MKLSVIGGGGFAGEVIDALLAGSESAPVEIVGVFDDDTRFRVGLVHGFPYGGTIADFIENTPPQSNYVWAIGNIETRERLAIEFGKHQKIALPVVHPQSFVSRRSIISAGAYVGAFAFVGPRSSIGSHAIVNVSASVGHDVKIGDFVQLCPGVRVSGFCEIGVGAFMGSNAVLGPGGKMGDHAILAACSYAHRLVPAGKLAVGIPAKVVL